MKLNVNDKLGKFYCFTNPLEIGCYSLDGERKFHDDNHQMKYIHMPPLEDLHLDLNCGSQNVIKKDYGQREKMNPILNWITLHPTEIETFFNSTKTKRKEMDFVCSRGLLKVIACTPFTKTSDWMFCASKHKSVIYLSAFDSVMKENWRLNQSQQETLVETWSSKFVQYMTSDVCHSKLDTLIPVNEKEEYNVVLKGKLNHHTLLYNAEIEGKRSCTTTNWYTKLKTNEMGPNGKYEFARYKYLCWYLQSYLAGVPEIIIGFRDKNGIVKDLRPLKTEEILPENRRWMVGKCMNFCSNVLDFVKICVKEDGPKIVYKFSWNPGSSVECEKLDFPKEYQVLPEWYLKCMK